MPDNSNRLHSTDSASVGIESNDEEVFTVNAGDLNGHLGCILPYASVCPCCKADSKYFRHLRFSSGFFNRILSSTLLEQAPANPNNPNLLWEGRKYIAFTDSRQGTARSALAQNIDIERIWIQSRVLHQLSSKRTENILPLTEQEILQLEHYRQIPNLFAQQIQELESRDNATDDPDNIPTVIVSWRDLYNGFINDTRITNELIILGKNILEYFSCNSSKHRSY